ncbi:hypothetical protein BH23GEM5_BH23GEM5_21880 [soil metagenome]
MINDIEVAPYSDALLRQPERDGSNPIERKAVYRTQVEIQSMPASLVVQIALWPDKLADWAEEMGIAPAVVYNMLAGVKPYHRVRALLARRLDVYKESLDHLIDARRPEPRAKLPPDPPETLAPPAPRPGRSSVPAAHVSRRPRRDAVRERHAPAQAGGTSVSQIIMNL